MRKIKEPFQIDRQSITDQVYHHIKQLILSGVLQGGEKIPEEKVAQQLQVSRTPIREALRKLENYGLVEIKPRSYAIVMDLDPSEAPQIAIIRLSLEKLSCTLLCDNVNDQDIFALKEIAAKCVTLMEENNLAEEFELDSQFHLEIARRTNNKHLYEIMEKLDAKIQMLRLRQKTPKSELINYVNQHEEIIRLLSNKNKESLLALIETHIMHDLNPAGAYPAEV